MEIIVLKLGFGDDFLAYQEDLYARGHILTFIIRGLNAALEEDIRRRVDKTKISNAGFRILWLLQFNEKIIMSDLAYLIQLNISSISRQLIKLEKDLLVHIKGGKDARKKEIFLTDKGREYIHQLIEQDGGAPKLRMIDATERISTEDLDKFIEVGSILCEQLLGEDYIEWGRASAQKIYQNRSH